MVRLYSQLTWRLIQAEDPCYTLGTKPCFVGFQAPS